MSFQAFTSVLSSVPNLQKPWEFSSEVTERLKPEPQKAYAILDITPDTLEFDFVRACYEHSMPAGKFIARVRCIYNAVLTNSFESRIASMERTRTQRDWRSFDQIDLRESVFERFESIMKCVGSSKIVAAGMEIHNTKVLAMWHGTKEEVIPLISESGFLYAGSETPEHRNDGLALFGNGIYESPSAANASTYSKDGNLLLVWTAVKSVFPALHTDNLQEKSFVGMHDAHYIPVRNISSPGEKPVYRACPPGEIPDDDELVVFQFAQVLPAFWVTISDSITMMQSPTSLLSMINIQQLSEEILRRLEEDAIQRKLAADFPSLVKRIASSAHNRFSMTSKIAFGKAKWEKYLGDIGEEPSFPIDTEETLLKEDPFSHGKKIGETHKFFLLPRTINGEPFTINKLGELVKHPRENGNATQYDRDKSWEKIFNEIGTQTLAQSSWVLMRKEVIPDSRGKTYAEQTALLENPTIPYRLPHLPEAITCAFLEYIENGELLYKDSPSTWVHCQGDLGMAVGGFSISGLRVSRSFDKHESHALSCVWKC